MGIEFCTSFKNVASNFKQPSKSFGADELPTNRAHSWPNPTSTSMHTGSGLLPVTYNFKCKVWYPQGIGLIALEILYGLRIRKVLQYYNKEIIFKNNLLIPILIIFDTMEKKLCVNKVL